MIEVGECVRTKAGIIGKLVMETLTYPEPSEWALATNGNSQEVIVECTDYPIKHSKNIIDLIEEGDYVNGELITDKWDTRVSSIRSNFSEEDIKTILTHQQYMANCYKVGGEDE